MANQAQNAFVLIPMEPLIDAIRVSWLQEPMFGDPMRRMPFGNLEKRSTTLSHMRPRVMMDRFFQRHALWLIKPEMPVMACFIHLVHKRLLSLGTPPFESLLLPILIVNVH